jgi:hypothetical protein
MNVAELIALLEDADPDAEVLMAHQPSWPLQFHVLGVYDAADEEPRCTAHEVVDCTECGPPEPNTAVYLVEGSHPDDTPYAPRSAWDQVRKS